MSAPQAVLVTGAAGFIGSTLVERLLAEGRRVVGVDSFDPFYPEEQKRRNLGKAETSPDFVLHRADIRDAEALSRVFASERIEGVVHLAALAGVRPSLERPGDYADVNVLGSTRILDAMVHAEVPHAVVASSSSVYGEREDGPFRESDPVERPISPYAATKRAAELVSHTFHHIHGTSVTQARIFTAFGPRQRPDLAIRKFAELMLAGETLPVYGDGSAVRDFTFVEDLVAGLVAALDRPLGFAILNFGAGRTISVNEVIATLERVLGVAARVERGPRQPGDVSKTWADIGQAQALLGYAPQTPFEEGVARFAAWLRDVR
ncbi:MAG: NAD-dependent epimerase/dehydratase family protein [Myxococcales bacterium]|nr:NAD-dependent epimerase/dehydratase family protein [Myxococcales bacterium]